MPPYRVIITGGKGTESIDVESRNMQDAARAAILRHDSGASVENMIRIGPKPSDPRAEASFHGYPGDVPPPMAEEFAYTTDKYIAKVVPLNPAYSFAQKKSTGSFKVRAPRVKLGNKLPTRGVPYERRVISGGDPLKKWEIPTGDILLKRENDQWLTMVGKNKEIAEDAVQTLNQYNPQGHSRLFAELNARINAGLKINPAMRSTKALEILAEKNPTAFNALMTKVMGGSPKDIWKR